MFEESKPLDEFESWVQTQITGRDINYKKKACVQLIEKTKKQIDPLGDMFKNNKQKLLFEMQKALYPYLDELFNAKELELGASILGVIHSKKIFELCIDKYKLNRKKMGSIFLGGVMESPFFTNFEKKRLYQSFDI